MRRVVIVVAEIAAALGLMVVFGAAGLAVRLGQGPLDVTRLARMVVGPGPATFSQVTLALEKHGLAVGATKLQWAGGPSAEYAAAVLELLPLLHGAVRPRDVTADGVRLHADRAADGTLAVQGMAGGSGQGGAGRGGDGAAMLAALRHVAVHGGQVDVDDAGTGQTAAVRDLVADVRRDAAGGLAGHATAVLAAGALASAVSVDASRAPGGASRVRWSVASVNPAAVAGLTLALAPLAAVDAPVALAGEAVLTPELTLQHATLHAEGGPGRLFLPAKGGGTSPGAFSTLVLDASGNAHAGTLTGLRLVLSPPSGAPPTALSFSGSFSRDGRAVAHLHVGIDRLQMADLGALWPAGVGGGARPWLVENVTAGTVHDGAFDLTLTADAGLDDAALTEAGGTMLADDVSVSWLRPVPPIDLPHVVLTLQDPDTLVIAAPVGHQGALLARAVAMRIWGMATKDQFGQIDGDITAPIADVFTFLKQPRLKLLSVHPLPVSTAGGQSATHLTVKLPLEAKVDFDSIGIHASTVLSHVRLPGLAAGRDLDQGQFNGDVTQDGITLSGTAKLAGIGVTVALGMDFRAGPPDQVVQHVALAASGDDHALGAAGLDTIGLVAGTVSAKVDYAEERNGHAWLQASADFEHAALSTPVGWSKPAGPRATVEARAELNHGRLAGFDQLRADGPNLSVRGRSDLVDGWPAILHIERCVIGRTNVTGTVSFPQRTGEALRVVLSGAQLDLSGPLNSRTTFESSTPDSVEPGRPYQVDLHFGRVLVGDGAGGIGPVSLVANGDARRIASAHFASTGPEQVDVRIEPHGDTRRVSASAADLGLLVRSLGGGAEIDQGALNVLGEFDDRRPGSPLSGTASLSRFGVRGTAVLGKVLQGMTLYGLVDALRGPGLVFDQATLPFTATGRVVELQDVRAYSASLGLTGTGTVDFARHALDLRGTIVPAYFFNTLPGRVPLIGRLFSPEPGGGLFAATYTVHGPLSDPAVGVNPLATLTPGALRGLFGLFD